MNLNSLKSVSFSADFFNKNPTGQDFNEYYNLSSDSVILSTYSISSEYGMLIMLLTNTDMLVGSKSNTFEPTPVFWTASNKASGVEEIAGALVYYGGVDSEKVISTLDSAYSKYGELYLHIFQCNFNLRYSGANASISINNSFHLNSGEASDGTFGSFSAFDIGRGQSFGADFNQHQNTGKLLEKANGDLAFDIGDPENPLDPSPELDGDLLFTIGSNGIGSGFNLYKLIWNVEHDTESVNYAQMEAHVGFMYKRSIFRDFRKATIGKSGSIDFSFQQALAHVGDYDVLDKIKEKLPILDPSQLVFFIEFFHNGEQITTGSGNLTANLNYDGSVDLNTPTQVFDGFHNSYRLDGGNEAGEDTKKDMEDDDTDKDDDETGDGDDKIYTGGTDSVNGSALLTTSYALTVQQIHAFGSWLWGSTLADDIKLVNNNPVENIVSAKLFPFSVSGTQSEVQLGNVTSNINGQKLAENVARTFTFGKTVTIPKYYSLSANYGGRYAFLDYACTRIQIYLPYIGIKELDPSIILDNPFVIKYYVDLVTGMCRCVLQSHSRNLYIFDGQIGQDIPITSSNRAQVEVGYIQGGIQTITKLLSSDLIGALSSAINTASIQYHSETTGTPTPCNSRFDSQQAYIIVDRPDVPAIPSSFEHQNGRICNKTMTISKLSGYVEIDNTVDLTGIKCLESEREELLSILSSGFYA